MKFTAVPHDFVKCVKRLQQLFPLRARPDSAIAVRATKDGVWIQAWLSKALMPVAVDEPGEFFTNWKAFGAVLRTYPKDKPVVFSLVGSRLQVDRYQFNVQTQPEPD